jgi:hypothetical protein
MLIIDHEYMRVQHLYTAQQDAFPLGFLPLLLSCSVHFGVSNLLDIAAKSGYAVIMYYTLKLKT